MAGVAAVEIGHPVVVFVLVKAGNASFHLNAFCLRVLPRLAVRPR